eukprot:883609-Lingulodinium_polyedra.AAC.1
MGGVTHGSVALQCVCATVVKERLKLWFARQQSNCNEKLESMVAAMVGAAATMKPFLVDVKD